MLPVIKYDSLISIHITYIQFYYALYFTLERRRDEKKKKVSHSYYFTGGITLDNFADATTN